MDSLDIWEAGLPWGGSKAHEHSLWKGNLEKSSLAACSGPLVEPAGGVRYSRRDWASRVTGQDGAVELRTRGSSSLSVLPPVTVTVTPLLLSHPPRLSPLPPTAPRRESSPPGTRDPGPGSAHSPDPTYFLAYI